jgi:hypothetical protein
MEDKNDKVDYSQGKIYKIVCNKTGLIYIGSTIKTLDERLKRHEECMNIFIRNYKTKKPQFLTSFFILLKKDYKIELIESYPCKSRIELEIKECEYMKLFPESVNFLRHPICHKNQLVNTHFVSDKRDINKYYDKLRNSVEK